MNCDDKLSLLCSDFMITLYLNVSCGLCLIRRHVKNVFHICLKKWKKYCSQIKHSNDKMRTTKMAMLLMSCLIRSQIIDKNYKRNVHSQKHKQSVVSWTLFSLFFYVKEGKKGLIYGRQPWISGLRTIYETLFSFLTCLCFKKLSYADLYLKPW